MQRLPAKNSVTSVNDLRLGPVSTKILQLRFEHPEWTQKRIADECGQPEQRVSRLMNNPRVRACYPILARARVIDMTPKALAVTEALLMQKDNLEVARKVSERVLSESKTFDAPTPQIQVNVFQNMPTNELAQFVAQNRLHDATVVDGELVDPPSAPPPQGDAPRR